MRDAFAALASGKAINQPRRRLTLDTGATSGYATDLLAYPEADTLGVIGSGVQTRTQVDAIRAVRRIKRVRVWSRSEEKRRQFAAELGAEAGAEAVAQRKTPSAALESWSPRPIPPSPSSKMHGSLPEPW